MARLKLQGEYFRRQESGALTFDDSGGSGVFGALTDDYKSTQSGWYMQAVYRFLPQWRAGYRYDRLDHGSVSNGMSKTAWVRRRRISRCS